MPWTQRAPSKSDKSAIKRRTAGRLNRPCDQLIAVDRPTEWLTVVSSPSLHSGFH